MNTLLASCITAIFSVWVWSLKHQMAQFAPLVATTGQGRHLPDDAHHAVSRPHPLPHPHAVKAHPEQQEEDVIAPSVRRNDDGVPVWKIDL